ncbi:MAG: hypothetical protein HY587_03940 [Candidatus Omnitrophica bacterium]|nr:hypothetical protein [Candidatus Omnitrophota bacterium]
MMTSLDLGIPTLGSCQIKSPVRVLLGTDSCPVSFVSDNHKVVFDPASKAIEAARERGGEIPMLELAGPRCEIYFDSAVLLNARHS